MSGSADAPRIEHCNAPARRSFVRSIGSPHEDVDALWLRRQWARKLPAPPFPKQHQQRPGIEAAIRPAPKFDAPSYVGCGKVKGRVAIVTGGDSGIGRAATVLLAREGGDVTICYLPEESTDAATTAEAIKKEGRRALLFAGDIGQPSFCEAVMTQTVARLGRLDILVNNAAFQQHRSSILEIDDEQWDRTFRTNIYGYFYMARAAQPEEIAPAIVFLASASDSSYITGEVLSLLAGETTTA
jgi:enoyl-[acyl-carrier-protein] reductase (NADH)